MRGLEPPRACAHTDLNRARLPIPPHPRGSRIVASLRRGESASLAVVALFDHGEVREVALDARRELVVVCAPLDQREVGRAPAPAAAPRRPRLALVQAQPLGDPRPLCSENEGDREDEEDGCEEPHASIVEKPLARPGRIAPLLRRVANEIRPPADTRRMRQDAWIPLLLVVTWGTIARAMLVSVNKLPPTCARCGLKLERRRLGERICRCGD
jgi:hypothetical protein